MSVNSSSTSNYLLLYFCPYNDVSSYISSTVTALRILLLLPLSTFVLYLGHQRWRQHRSSKPATHSDVFTYHVASMELIWIMGSFCLIGGTCIDHLEMMKVGMYICAGPYTGELYFHVLTCVERYLAVVHPIIYMGLRNARGVKIRNICTGCVWLLCFAISFVLLKFPSFTFIPSFCLLSFCLIIISFCSLSVLCVLIRPGPGEGGGEKQHVDQSKLRAFYNLTAISVTVWLWFVGLLVSNAVTMSPEMGESVRCVVSTSVGFLNLPSTLVSPLLYLHRAGKLSWCHRNK